MGNNIYKNNIDEVKEEIFSFINWKNDDQYSKLLKLIQRVISNNIELHSLTDDDGNSPLHAAVINMKPNFVRIILQNGCQARTVNFKGDSPLHTAIKNGDLDIINQLLYADGVNLCLSRNLKANTPLHTATVSNSSKALEIFKRVFEYCGTDEVNAVNARGLTCLHIACMNNNNRLLKFLLSRTDKVNINIGNKNGWTALHEAAKTGNKKAVKLLCKYHADLSVTDCNGYTPIHIAAMYKYDSCIKVMLQSENINENRYVIVECRDKYNNFPLHYALGCDHEFSKDKLYQSNSNRLSYEMIKLLIECEVNHLRNFDNLFERISILQKNNDGITPLDLVNDDENLKSLLLSYLPDDLKLSEDDFLNVQIASDLHTEFVSEVELLEDFVANKGQCKYLFLIGDIGIPHKPPYKDFVIGLSKHYEKVFIVSGNHEYYGSSIEETDKIIEDICESTSNVIYLRRGRSVILEGVRIIGCTLWTDIPNDKKLFIASHLSDYTLIKIKDKNGELRPLRVDDTIDFHRKDIQFIENELQLAKENNEPVALFTHHSPIINHGCSNPLFWGSDSNSAFCTDLSYLFPHINTWCYGHTHWCHNMTIYGTHIVANQRGYPISNNSIDSKAYNPNCIISIPKKRRS